MSTASMIFDIFGEDKGVGSMFEKVAGHGKNVTGVLGGIGAAAAGMGIVHEAEKSVTAFEDTAKAAYLLRQETGATAEDSSRLGYALSAVGLSADEVSKPMGIFSKNLVATEGDAKKHAAMVKQLGFEYLDANGKVLPLTEIMPKLSEKFHEMPDGADKTSAALHLFGKAGASMIPFLNEGTDAMHEQMKKSDELGLTLSGPAVDDARKYALAQKEWDNTMRGLMVTIGGALMPVLEGFKEMVRGQIVPAIADVVKWFKDLSPSMQGWIMGITTAVLVGGPFLLLIGKLAGAMSNVINVVKDVQKAFSVMSAFLAANPFVMVLMGIALLVAGLIYAYDHVGWFKDFVDTAFRNISNIVNTVVTFITGTLVPLLVNGWNNAANQAQAVGDTISAAWNAVTSTISDMVNNVRNYFLNMGDNIRNTWNNIVSGTQTAVGQVVDWFTGLPGRILGAIGNLGGLLLNVGGQIIGGLTKGIQDALGGLGDVLGSVGKFISDHKGPEEYDKNLLVPHGGWIMGGLMEGIRGSMPDLNSLLGHVADTVSGGLNASAIVNATTAGASVTSYGSGGGSAPAVVDLHGYSLHLNADATMATFQRMSDASTRSAIESVNDDIYRGRSR